MIYKKTDGSTVVGHNVLGECPSEELYEMKKVAGWSDLGVCLEA